MNALAVTGGIPLHRYKYLWRKCQDRHVIVAAWRKLRKGKTNRKEVIEIEESFDHYVDKMQETIFHTRPGGDPEKMFTPLQHKPKIIYEHGKERKIYCPSIWEQWFHHIVIHVLAPIIMRTSYPWSCGSMPKRGGLYGKKHLAKTIKRRGFKYFVKLDVRHFFNNVRLNEVMKRLRRFVEDEWFMFMVERIFLYFKKGLPLGFYPSQWFSNFILCELDWNIHRRRFIDFVRYMDDLVIAGNNKRALHRLVGKIKQWLGKMKLRLKGNFQVIRFDYENPRTGKRYGRPIDFMGYLFWRGRTTLRRGILFKTTRFARRLGQSEVIACKQAQSMLSRVGWFKHSHTKHMYKTKVQPHISVISLKNIVRKEQRRLWDENRVDERNRIFDATAIREAQRDNIFTAAQYRSLAAA